MAEERLLSFKVADTAFAVPANGVREVTRRPHLTRVPQGPSSLAGLMNFHGSAIPVVRLSAVLGLSGVEADSARVVVYGDSPPVGLLVDKVLDLDLAASQSGKRLDIADLLAKNFVARPTERKTAKGFDTEQPSDAVAEDTVAILGFDVSGQRFALPLEAVTEALALPANLAVVPRTDESVVGMLDWREAVLPLISLSALLGLDRSVGRMNVLVVKLGDALVGLVCGAIEGVLRVPVSLVEAVPPILQRGEGDAEIDAIARVDGGGSLISILSPKKLFHNRDIAGALDRASTGSVEMQTENQAVATLQLLVFTLGSEMFGLPLGAVEEIVQLPDALTRVPKAPKFVAGVMNLRGRALPIIDLRERFQSDAIAASGRPRVIVVATKHLQAGFIVDGVSEILRVEEAAISPAPPMPGDGARVFDRVTPGGNGVMILIVDPQELLDRAERDLLAKFRPAQGTKAAK